LGKVRNFISRNELACDEDLFTSEPSMVDDAPLRTRVHVAWSLYLTSHRDRVAIDGARPDWTSLAISELASASVVLSFRSMSSV